MKNILYIFLFSGLFSANAQNHPTCDGDRYLIDVFDEITVTSGVKFGEGTTVGGNFKELRMDIYEPVGDTVEARPTIVLAFGGSFIFGTRSDLDFLCRAYARKGYVAATIDYRLYDGGLFPLPDEEDMLDVVTKAIGDMKAAIRYLREDAANDNLYRIDPDYIFSGGISAGAITAAHVACMDSTDNIAPDILDFVELNGGFEGNSSSNYEYSSAVQGFVNFSGALRESEWLTSDDPPFVSVHEEFDNVVPYYVGTATIFGVPIAPLEGSGKMKEVADSVGVTNELRTFWGSSDHIGYFNNGGQAEIDFSAEFLYNILCENETSDSKNVNELPSVSVFPNPTNGILKIQNEEVLPLRFTIFNSVGQQLFTAENVDEIDLSDLNSALYFLQIQNPKTNQRRIEMIVLER